MEYFQDDIFPETRVTWEAVLTAEEWLAGRDGAQPTLSLKPVDMESREYNYHIIPLFLRTVTKACCLCLQNVTLVEFVFVLGTKSVPGCCWVAGANNQFTL